VSPEVRTTSQFRAVSSQKRRIHNHVNDLQRSRNETPRRCQACHVAQGGSMEIAAILLFGSAALWFAEEFDRNFH
jgi:hypothetical protein